MNSLGNIVNIGGGYPTHTDPARLEKIQMFLLFEKDAHLLGEACVGEHPNLCGDVAPVSRGSEIFQLLSQTRSHGDDTSRHHSDTFSPLLIQFLIGQDCIHNPGSVSWRIAHHGSDDQRHLALDVVHIASVGRHDGQVARPLVVQPKVLAEGLGAEQLESFRDKEPDGPGIRVETSGGESLIGAVKEREQLVRTTNLRDLLPLVLGWVDASGVVCACVEDDDGLGWS